MSPFLLDVYENTVNLVAFFRSFAGLFSEIMMIFILDRTLHVHRPSDDRLIQYTEWVGECLTPQKWLTKCQRPLESDRPLKCSPTLSSLLSAVRTLAGQRWTKTSPRLPVLPPAGQATPRALSPERRGWWVSGKRLQATHWEKLRLKFSCSHYSVSGYRYAHWRLRYRLVYFQCSNAEVALNGNND
jgi:hypothetical protein